MNYELSWDMQYECRFLIRAKNCGKTLQKIISLYQLWLKRLSDRLMERRLSHNLFVTAAAPFAQTISWLFLFHIDRLSHTNILYSAMMSLLEGFFAGECFELVFVTLFAFNLHKLYTFKLCAVTINRRESNPRLESSVVSDWFSMNSEIGQTIRAL